MARPTTLVLETLYTKQEVAKALRVSTQTVMRRVASKELAAVRIGQRGVRFTAAAVQAYIDRNTDGVLSLPVKHKD